jgi:hypothetical protein
MRRLPLVVALVLVLVSGVSVYAVPYPYGEYTLETKGDLRAIAQEVFNTCTIFVKAEGDSCYPWSALSSATFHAPALIDATINRDAEFQFWTDAEKEQERKKKFSLFVDDTIVIGMMLVADSKVDRGYRYVETEGPRSYIDRIVLETDAGKRYTPTFQYGGGDSELSGLNWMSITLLSFPRYDNGVQIINKDTEWIRLWVIAGTNRIYFQFDFDK